MVADCQECTRLWAEYTGLVLAWFKVEGQYKLAVHLRDEPEKIEHLLLKIEEAFKVSQQAKHKLEQHEQKEHAGSLESSS